MGAPIGHKKWGGRQKGTLNKIHQDLFEICEQMNCVPFRGLIEFAMGEEYDPAIRFAAYREICGYLYAKRRAIEVTMDENNLDDKSDEELLVILEKATKTIKSRTDQKRIGPSPVEGLPDSE